MIITIDGPSGSGKGTAASKLANLLSFTYFDTGAMYRILSVQIMRKKIGLSDHEALKRLLDDFSFETKIIEGKIHYFVKDSDVTEEIRTPQVEKVVTEVAANPEVRVSLRHIQKEFGKKGKAVFEGRDLGSVIFPGADLKIFLTAKDEIRAKRRFQDFKKKHPELTQDQVLQEIKRRDLQDSTRTVAPLRCPKDAYIVDTSDKTVDQVIEECLSLYKQTIRKWHKPWRAKKMTLFYRFSLFCSCFIFKCLYRHKVYGLEHFQHGRALIASNHLSFYDPPLIAASLPDELHFLAKETLFHFSSI